jgi:hypothetical protein
MSTIPCVFRSRDSGRVLEMDVSTKWTVSFLRSRVQDEMGVRVRTLKYKRREMADGDCLGDLGLNGGATIFVNSQTLSPAPIAKRPRVCGFSEEAIGQRVSRLEALGYPRGDCEKALRAAAFNLDRAADYLAGGRVPEPFAADG